MELVNLTSYAAHHSILMDGTGRETLLVLVKATFTLDTGRPVFAEDQEPVALVDEYIGEPDASSLRCANDVRLFKPSADVTLSGSAHTARDDRSEVLVALQVGPLRKAVRVLGDRVWGGWLGANASHPEPFVEMPLVYERAYGGCDMSSEPPQSWPENPVGLGFRAKSSRAPVAGARLPNLEDPLRPIAGPKDRPSSRCFGAIAPSWSPRVAYAGTYDLSWQRDRMPLAPADFDPRFEHPTPADQVLPGYLSGGEPVTITGVRPEGGGYHFALPSFSPEVIVRIGGEREAPQVRCDTLAIDCQRQRLSLVSRATTSIHGRVGELEWIKIQEPARA